MRYDKKPLTFEVQAEQLLQRGLQADVQELIRRLRATNYYRFTSYLYTFRDQGENYRSGTTLEQVWDLYRFDHGLRLLLLDAIETIEVHARTQLAYHFAHAHDAFAYLDSSCLPNFDRNRDDFGSWECKLRGQVSRSRGEKGKEDFIVHFYQKYGDNHDMPPVWMMAELMDFGSVLSFYRGVSTDIRRKLAAALGLSHQVTINWLLVLNSVRNRCAHHARLWNWNLGYPVTIPERDPRWAIYRNMNRRLAAVLHVCRHWLAKADAGHAWHQRVSDHFAKHPHIDLLAMGLRPGWQDQALWKNPS
jgi:abortive infection bacteriophage resistance protein